MKFIIGDGSSILLGCRFSCKGSFSIGINSTINQRCFLDNRGRIEIGSQVSVSPSVSILTADHDVHSTNFIGRTKSVIIEDYVFVGYQALILKGVILRKGSVVSAMACQHKNTLPYGVYAGVPSVHIANRTNLLDYNPTYKRLFH